MGQKAPRIGRTCTTSGQEQGLFIAKGWSRNRPNSNWKTRHLNN